VIKQSRHEPDEPLATPQPEEQPAVETIALAHKYSLELERNPDGNVLHISSQDGLAGVSITVSSRGLELRLKGGDLHLQTSGALAIDAEQLSLHGRRGVAITSDGDASLHAVGDFSSEARIQNIRARLGNVNVRANDDVELNGERIKLNT
jgi:hypothetical protein